MPKLLHERRQPHARQIASARSRLSQLMQLGVERRPSPRRQILEPAEQVRVGLALTVGKQQFGLAVLPSRLYGVCETGRDLDRAGLVLLALDRQGCACDIPVAAAEALVGPAPWC